jgi:hypothetical protein
MPLRFSLRLVTLLIALAAAPLSAATIAEVELGVGGIHRLGEWFPVRIAVEDAEESEGPLTAVVSTPDTEGVAMLTSAPVSDGTAEVLCRLGRQEAVLEIALLDGEQSVVARRTVRTSGAPPQEATTRCVLVVGEMNLEAVNALVPGGEQPDKVSLSRAVKVAELPRTSWGLAAFDSVVMGPSAANELRALGVDDVRLLAVRQWVQFGGRLVFAVGDAAPKLLAANSPWAELAGCVAQLATPQFEFGELEEFAGADEAVPLSAGATVSVVKLAEVRDRLLAGDAELPLIVSNSIGFGEVVSVAIDLNTAALVEWKGRRGLLRNLLGIEDDSTTTSASAGVLTGRGATQISAAIREQLDLAVPGAERPTLLTVMAGLIGYLLLLGPGCYFVVQRFGRPGVAWLLFPLVIIGAAAIALQAGKTAPLAAPPISQLEIVDVLPAENLARGALFAQLGSARAERFELTLSPKIVEATTASLAWHGATGAGLGGMNSASSSVGATYSAEISALHGVPIPTGATRSFTAKWLAPSGPVITAELTASDGLVSGAITNDTTQTFKNARLIYGDWAWRIPQLAAGETVEISEELAPLKFRMMVDRDFLGADGLSRQAIQYDRIDRLAPLLMFARQLQPSLRAPLSNERERMLDVSTQLAAGRAMLLVPMNTPATQLASSGEPITPIAAATWTYYRYFLSVVSGQ